MKTRKFTGLHMVLCLLGFFGTVAAANLTLAIFANNTWTGLVVENSFKASQDYNEVLAEARQQEAMGWKADLVFGDGRLDFKIADRNGTAVRGLDVTARIGRPTNENEDMDVSFISGSGSGYVASPQLGAGQWDVDLVARNGNGVRFRRIFRLQIDPERG